jgi:hypothetical protein
VGRIHRHNPKGYSRFCEPYRRWEGKLSVTMRQTHLGADELFVDYAGDNHAGDFRPRSDMLNSPLVKMSIVDRDRVRSAGFGYASGAICGVIAYGDKSLKSLVEPRGFEPLTSAVRLLAVPLLPRGLQTLE